MTRLALTLALLLAASPAWATITVTDDCERTTVNTAISAMLSGDTIIIKAGSCTWSSAISLPTNKNWIIKGQGSGSTTITANTNDLFTIGNMGTYTGEIADITLSGPAGDYLIDSSSYLSTNACGSLYIHDVIFRDCKAAQTAGCIRLGGPCPTLITENQFICTGGTKCALDLNNPDDADWTAALDMGSAGPRTVFVEENYFEHAYDARYQVDSSEHNWLFIDTTSGGRYVARWNVFKNGYVSNHGSCYSAGVRGAVQREVYNNWVYHETGKDCGGSSCDLWRGIHTLSGTGIFAYNVIEGDVVGGISFSNNRSDSSCNFGAQCDGNSALDGNTNPIETYAGYLCQDQPGSHGAATEQVSTPIYVWGNEKCNTVTTTTANCQTNPRACVQEAQANCNTALSTINEDGTIFAAKHFAIDRDIFLSASPSWSQYTYPHPLRGVMLQLGVGGSMTLGSGGGTITLQ